MSEVIGVVLLVALVVVLAAVVAVAVMGIDSEREPAPQFSKVEDFDRGAVPNGQYLNVTHGSGETVGTGDLSLVVAGAVVRARADDSVVGDASLKSGAGVAAQVGDEWAVSETVSVNATMFESPSGDVQDDEYLDLRQATVRIVWVPENEGTSDVLYRWEGPDA